MRTPSVAAAVGAAALLLAAGCGTGAPRGATPSGPSGAVVQTTTPPTSSNSPTPASRPTSSSAPTSSAPLRPGEVWRTVSVPAAYTPKAPTSGTDDYRCFLLDPKLTRTTFVTGFDVLPGEPSEVHHVILYRVPQRTTARARAMDAATPGDGWTCFGGTGLESQGASLDDAPWVGAWAPGGHERLLAPDVGIPLEAGSQLVLQVHYNLLKGARPDRTSVRLRLSTSTKLAPLDTMLLPAPVELPCRSGRTGGLCDRDNAVLDVMARFGQGAGRTVAGLLLMCTGSLDPKPGPTQSCTRRVTQPATVRAVAGHMHLLGSALRIELNPGTARARTLLDIPVWDFDNQGAVPVPATKLEVGDEVQVTCTHDQAWRDRLPALADLPERYVVWGEGTTDEMCLGILSVTRP